MRYLKAISGLVFAAGIIYLGNTRLGQLPPILKFIDPYHGFWQNAEFADADLSEMKIDGLNQEAKVVFGERGVPHIFAQNDHDLYFLQGYLTARDRLWQMEFQTHAAAGRISEIIGEKTINFDLEQRRIGMLWAAQRALDTFQSDSLSYSVVDAYTQGINHFIDNLSENELALEYKLLDYRPEKWTHLKSALLLKHMAKMLSLQMPIYQK